jgi:hypothetical protein
VVRKWLPARAWTAVWLLVTSALALTSCGGGGGSGGSGSLTFAADKSSISFDFTQGQSPVPQIVTIQATGQYSGSLYVAAKASGPELSSPIPITVTGTTATAQISAASGLTPGTYTGQLQLLACSDSACTQQVGNSPLVLAYTVTVRVPILLNPASISTTVLSGTAPTQLVNVQLPPGQTTFSTNISGGSDFISITNVTPSSFTIALSSLPSGLHIGFVDVTSGTSTARFIVSYVITAPVGGDRPLTVTPTSLTLATTENATTSANLGVSPPSWDPNVTATAEYPPGLASGWLTLTATAGSEQVLANAATLPAGSYTANIRLHGAFPASDVLVPVALTVGTGLVRPADQSLTVGAETTSTMLSGAAPVNVVSGPVTGWTASSSVPWLLLTKSSGQTGESLTYNVDAAQLDALPNAAVSTAVVTIRPTLGSITPVRFNVNVNKNLPRITSVGPYVQLTGQTARVILRGTGFSSVTSLMSRVTMQGATTNSAVLVNDSEVVIQFSPLSAGSHTVSVSNALGLSTTTGNVIAVVAPAYAYTAISTGGQLRSLAYDPERDSLYAANTTVQSIMSFQHSGGTWIQNSALFAKALDVGLTQDGGTLLATSDLGTAGGIIRALNPTTLATVQSAALNYNFLPSLTRPGFGIPTTNDGRSWLGIALPIYDYQSGNLAFLAPGSLSPTIVTGLLTGIPPVINFYNGPWFAMSRDGERLIITQAAGLSPPPPMLYMNAADSVVRSNPAGLTYAYYFSLSETGDRMLFDNITVRDGQFNLFGAARIPTVSGQPDYYEKNGQVTPDGSRIYVVAYRSDADTQPSVTPRVFVFDATTAQANLPVLGYFDIPDYPGCIPTTVTTSSCVNPTIAGAISLDGGTLFFAGNERLIIAPVPVMLTPVSAAPTTPVLHRQNRFTATPWPINVH